MFSFYYRNMLPAELLAVAPAFNMHGSLLPQFRGRAPVNWAVLHGATETGATLHEMTVKPDAGAIVAQSAVPILPDDTAGAGRHQRGERLDQLVNTGRAGRPDGVPQQRRQDRDDRGA